MHISLFDFELPEDLIAQSPVRKRDESRLLVINKKTQTIEHKHFFDIVEYLKVGDVLVRNNTRVIPARLFGIKEVTHAKVEVLLLKQIVEDTWECLVGNAKTVKIGTIISFGEGKLRAECLEIREEGIRIFKMIYAGIFLEVLEDLGRMPLPPYIKNQVCDNSQYQTIYAKIQGSSAAPTAGFHFTEEIFNKLKEKGVEILDVTLHIGLGTFRPIKVDEVLQHEMHYETYEISEEVARALNKAKKEKRRIIAIGTTSTRVLESVMAKFNEFKADKAETNIFIYPPYKFKAIDGLITNFHLPKSTLVMLVSAFANREFILEAYCEAIKERYRFFSFGDAMFIYE